MIRTRFGPPTRVLHLLCLFLHALYLTTLSNCGGAFSEKVVDMSELLACWYVAFSLTPPGSLVFWFDGWMDGWMDGGMGGLMDR